MYVFLNIGSNLGNRRLNLSKAVAAIEKEVGYFQLSHTIESRPWGYVSDNAFLNVGMMFQTELEPLDLLDRLQAIERQINKTPHRDDKGEYNDREIDIDIVAIDEMQIDTERLTVPHRHLAERSFFLEPMQELAPAWRHPATGLTPAEMLSQMRSEE